MTFHIYSMNNLNYHSFENKINSNKFITSNEISNSKEEISNSKEISNLLTKSYSLYRDDTGKYRLKINNI